MARRRPPAVLLGGDDIAVSVARSLAAAGIYVTVLGDRYAQARYSRACREFACPEPDEDLQTGWLRWLRERHHRDAVLLACSDDGLELVAARRAELRDLGYHPFEANDDAVRTVLDKRRTYELAQAAGIPVPEFAVPANDDALVRVSSRFAYPCVLKPLASHRYHQVLPAQGKLVVVATADELVREHRRLASVGLEAMVTDLVPGPDTRLSSYYTYRGVAGSPLFELVGQKLRQFPPRFGDGCYRVTRWDADVADVGQRFLAAADVRGLAYVEFKRDERDGELKLIECNHRFGSGIELLRRAGIDAALLSYERALGSSVRPTAVRRDGVRLWHPTDDVRAFLAYRREGELSFPTWARTLLHRQHVPVFRFSDPLPTVMQHWGMLARAVRRRARAGMRRARVGEVRSGA